MIMSIKCPSCGHRINWHPTIKRVHECVNCGLVIIPPRRPALQNLKNALNELEAPQKVDKEYTEDYLCL